MSLLNKFRKVPVLMELLRTSYEFKEGLAYDKDFLKMAGLSYKKINGEDFDMSRIVLYANSLL